MKKNKNEFMIGIIFFVLGLIFFVIGIGLFISQNILNTNYKKVTGRIIEITDGHDVLVEYRVDRQVYYSKLNYWLSSMKVGNPITFEYNINDPSILKPKTGFLIILFSLIGFVALIFGTSFLMKNKSYNKKLQILKTNGVRIDADIQNIEYNKGYTVNDEHPIIIKCIYIDPYTKEQKIYNSPNLWINPTSIIETYGIKTLPVYYDKSNPKKYIVDLEPIERYLKK